MNELLTTEDLSACGVDSYVVNFFSVWLHGALPLAAPDTNRLVAGFKELRREAKKRIRHIEQPGQKESAMLAQVKALLERIGELRSDIRKLGNAKLPEVEKVKTWEKEQVKSLFAHPDTIADIRLLTPPPPKNTDMIQMTKRPMTKKDYENLRTKDDCALAGRRKARARYMRELKEARKARVTQS